MAILLIITLITAQIMLIVHLSFRDLGLFDVMMASLAIKVLVVLTLFRSIDQATSDATMYFQDAQALATGINGFEDAFGTHLMWGTSFITNITAYLIKLIGPSYIFITIVFMLISYWGSYLYYRTFLEIFPRVNRRYARIGLFLYPSVVFGLSRSEKTALCFSFWL